MLSGAPPELLPGGGGADPEAMYNICLILKIMLQKSFCEYNITLSATVFVYVRIQLHVPRLNHSVLASCFFLILLTF
jgi:hypothetical protein